MYCLKRIDDGVLCSDNVYTYREWAEASMRRKDLIDFWYPKAVDEVFEIVEVDVVERNAELPDSGVPTEKIAIISTGR